MRRLPLVLILFTASLPASEPAFSLWDNHESVADYAKRVNLPPTKTLDLGNGVKLDLVLIPAGKFMMGTPEPTPVHEDAFRTNIIIGQSLLAASVGALTVMLGVIATQAIRRRQRPKFSLLRLLAITIVAGTAVVSGLHWRQSALGLLQEQLEYEAAKARFLYEGLPQFRHRPAHSVTLTEPFYMGKFVVTQAQYQAVTGAYLGQFTGNSDPAQLISWDDAQDFCKKVSDATRDVVRLPTEAEWEYACRAGTNTTYYSGDTEADLARVAWYFRNSHMGPHPVGQKEPNFFGLYDMHGNVSQWCLDFMGDYSGSPAIDPQGPDKSEYDDQYRITRGGAWDDDPKGCRAAAGVGVNPTIHGRGGDAFGFRVVVVAPKVDFEYIK